MQAELRKAADGDDPFTAPHYLNTLQIVRIHQPPGTLLFVQTASLHSGDGDQLVSTQVLTYERAADRFARIYDHLTGRNNNQEVRLIQQGPLQGDIISVEPTNDAPFAFRVSVNAPTQAHTYKEVLRYRSATLYSDGNPLPVIDSEIPNIEHRLGLWQQGQKLPVSRQCLKPHLIRMELWCG